ncbi:MAG: ATP-binding cassette domain-containing protein [Bacteroidia bacterium]|nr:ATP-binding cassette domain-containing protein [Bacteroidia bacterium]MDW8159437.1 ATP-binding cassette domain-containing protein [Bacteroidia bacterium]
MLNVQNLCLSLGEKQILQNIDLQVEAASRVGLIGASGSGKSLLALTLLQLLPPTKKKSLVVLFSLNLGVWVILTYFKFLLLS